MGKGNTFWKMYGLPWIPILVTGEAIRQKWKSLPIGLTSDQIEYRREWIYYFNFTRYYMPWSSTQVAKITINFSTIYAKDGLFWFGIVTPPHFNLWRHANAGYWYCHVTFVHWSCTRKLTQRLQYIPRNMHMVFALLCFVVVVHWLIFPYPSGLLHWHCGNLTIAPVPAKQPWWIWINTLYEFIMNDCITTTKQSTAKPCAYFLGYTVTFHKWVTTLIIDFSPPGILI